MSLARKCLLLTVIAAILSPAHPAVAELHQHTPILPDCCEVEHKYTWFEPIYCDCTEEPPYSTGLFFHFEQLFVNGSRSEEAPGGVDFGDNTNGSRYDFGYMYEKTGWACSVLKINNPGVRLLDTNVARAPIIDPDGDFFLPGEFVPRGAALNGDIVIVNLAGNPIGDVFETLNSFNLYGVELNHLWRMEPTHRGILLEPFLGLRYVRFRDHFNTATYEFNQDLTAVPAFGPPSNIINHPWLSDEYTLDETTTDNDMFGGQFGMRISRRRGRWNYSTDLRGFTFHNFVTRNRRIQTIGAETPRIATYDATGVLTTVVLPSPPTSTKTNTTAVDRGTDAGLFVFGGELRADLAFAITKMFEVSVGGELLVLGDGIARGQFATDQTFVAGGVTLGFAINR